MLMIKNRITAWRKHWPLASQKFQSRLQENVARKNIDGIKSMSNKPEIKAFDPRHDLRAPLDLQVRAEKVIDEINHVEKITSDDLIQSASRAAKIPLLNIKQYMRNNVSLYMETLQCWHARSSGECSKLPSCAWKNSICQPRRNGNETTSSNDLFANVSHVSRQVVPRPMIQGKFFPDARARWR